MQNKIRRCRDAVKWFGEVFMEKMAELNVEKLTTHFAHQEQPLTHREEHATP